MVVLSTELTDELIGEGMVRDLVRVVQDRRKELDCDFTDRIALGIVTESIPLQNAIKAHEGYLAAETLSQAVSHAPIIEVSGIDIQLGEHELTLYVEVVDP